LIAQRNILQIGVGGNMKERGGLVDAISPGSDYYIPLYYKTMKIDFDYIKSLPTLVMECLFRDTHSYVLVHNLSQHPLYLKTRKTKILLTTVHEFQERQFPQFNHLAMQTLKGALWRYIITKPGIVCALKSDYLIATSQLIRDGLIEEGYPKDNIFLGPLGIRPEFMLKPIKKMKHKGFRIAAIGTQGPQKHSEFSIEAVKQLPLKDNYSFEIWGNSIYTEKQLDSMVGGDSRIKIMGPVPQILKLDVYDSFDAFVFPSRYEGFGMPIQEAKARGLPVIIWKYGKISKELRKYCFEATDPAHMAEIIQNIRDNGYNAKLRKKAIASARKFTIQRMARGILDAYEEIIKREGL
jgi:glycosyltransferase involved in cell wall biosynthesis